MTSQVTRIVVTPASNPTAYSLIPYLAQGYVTGPEQGVEIVLHDVEERVDVTRGVAMEIMDCVYPLVRGISTNCHLNRAMIGVDLLVVLPAGGQTGLGTDLLRCPANMKVVLVGTKMDLGYFKSASTVPKENILFIETPEGLRRPMTQAHTISKQTRPWWRDQQQRHMLGNIALAVQQNPLTESCSRDMHLKSSDNGLSQGHGDYEHYSYPRL
ncbi:probable malate dehydrogenase 3 isoform X2 [Haliotis asinina]